MCEVKLKRAHNEARGTGADEARHRRAHLLTQLMLDDVRRRRRHGAGNSPLASQSHGPAAGGWPAGAAAGAARVGCPAAA